jgi:pyridoxal phosphate enzyme (YggS family)
MSTVAEKRTEVCRRIEEACARCQRDPSTVTLLAVSKLQPEHLIREAYAAGQRDFGENYAQELRDKATSLASLSALRWHAIGPLQLNKAKYVAKSAYAFHALDRLELAKELAQRRTGAPLRCFLQVNLAGEQNKSGFTEAEAEPLLEEVRKLQGLQAVGLMTLPPLSDNPEQSRPYFARLWRLCQRLGLSDASMGTTSDFEIAIEEGATVVRVGTALFGERDGTAKSP